MKKKWLVFFCIVILAVLLVVTFFYDVKIEKEQPSEPDISIKKNFNDDVLRQVLTGEKEFIDSKGNEISINNLTIKDVAVKINQYAFVDLDGDYNNEIVAITDSYYAYCLILHIDNNIIYGYNIEKDKLQYINSLGVIYNKENNSIKYRKLKFNKNKYKFIDLATFVDGRYMINDLEVSIDEFNYYQDNYIREKIINYRSIDTLWMENALTSKYSFTKDKVFKVDTGFINYIFMNDQVIENFNSDLLNGKFTLYFMDSNNNTGKVYIRKSNEELLQDNNDLSYQKCVAVYDEYTQFIAIIINNDRLDSGVDNNLTAYYFKYYNKDIQYLGNYDIDNVQSLFNDDILNKLQ